MFVLEQVVLARDQVLELALAALVSCPEGLVGVKQQTLCHVRVELPNDVAWIGHKLVIAGQQISDYLTNDGLAHSHLAAKAQCRARLFPRVLKYLGEISDDPVIVKPVTTGNVFQDVIQEL